MSDLETAIINIVMEKAPIKGVDLALEIARDNMDYTADQIIIAIENLSRRKKIIEVEYILPHMEYRVKSIYFPASATIRLL